MRLVVVLFAVARDAAALRTPLITAKIGGGERRVAESFGPYEYLRTASLDECFAAAPFFCDKLQAPLDDETQRGLDAMLGSANGVRGFFLAWNNDPDFVIPDESPPPPALLSSFEQACGTPDPAGGTRACVRARCVVHDAMRFEQACCAPGPTGFVAKTLLMNIAMPAAAACELKRDGGSEAGEQAAMRSYPTSQLAHLLTYYPINLPTTHIHMHRRQCAPTAAPRCWLASSQCAREAVPRCPPCFVPRPRPSRRPSPRGARTAPRAPGTGRGTAFSKGNGAARSSSPTLTLPLPLPPTLTPGPNPMPNPDPALGTTSSSSRPSGRRYSSPAQVAAQVAGQVAGQVGRGRSRRRSSSRNNGATRGGLAKV